MVYGGWVGIRGQELLLFKTGAGTPPKSSTGAGTRQTGAGDPHFEHDTSLKKAKLTIILNNLSFFERAVL